MSGTKTSVEPSGDISSEGDDSDEDEEWSQFKEEEIEYSPLNECLLDIRHTITSLWVRVK